MSRSTCPKCGGPNGVVGFLSVYPCEACGPSVKMPDLDRPHMSLNSEAGKIPFVQQLKKAVQEHDQACHQHRTETMSAAQQQVKVTQTVAAVLEVPGVTDACSLGVTTTGFPAIFVRGGSDPDVLKAVNYPSSRVWRPGIWAMSRALRQRFEVEKVLVDRDHVHVVLKPDTLKGSWVQEFSKRFVNKDEDVIISALEARPGTPLPVAIPVQFKRDADYVRRRLGLSTAPEEVPAGDLEQRRAFWAKFWKAESQDLALKATKEETATTTEQLRASVLGLENVSAVDLYETGPGGITLVVTASPQGHIRARDTVERIRPADLNVKVLDSLDRDAARLRIGALPGVSEVDYQNGILAVYGGDPVAVDRAAGSWNYMHFA